MSLDRRKFVLLACGSTIGGLLSVNAFGETYSLSGKVRDTAAHAVPSASVWVKRMRDGKVMTAETNADGDYALPDLEPGDYKVWAKAGELEAAPVKVTLSAGQTTDLVVSPALHRSGTIR
ncbi:carboxypeptidase-like regulatory domain-containing protein [Occallatibacter savannae]|uniref:carboxypeptidase-like regulatory domain-containing protein n=1 Tax=Occallatibacter savannae TaxID=1002691 RepID=UPI0013A54805|nr:carboxypeptidase-like regulatory domain-containing protein [Occallatibacter savannae]